MTINKYLLLVLYSLLVFGCALFRDVNEKDEYGRTPLMNAAGECYLEEVKTLIGQGANVNLTAKDKYSEGTTALMLAARGMNDPSCRFEVVKLLVGKGADVNAKDSDGDNALSRAINFELNEIAKYLVERTTDINGKDTDGNTILLKAASKSNIELVKLLVEKGADVNAKNNTGRTALLNTLNRELINYLLEKGADINAEDNNGNTVLYYAYDYNLQELKDFLIKKGANKKYALKRHTDFKKYLETRDEGRMVIRDEGKSKYTKSFCLKWADNTPASATPKNKNDISRACSNLWSIGTADHTKCVETWKECEKHY